MPPSESWQHRLIEGDDLAVAEVFGREEDQEEAVMMAPPNTNIENAIPHHDVVSMLRGEGASE